MRIGFTGHRPNRLHIGPERVAARLTEFLTACRDDAETGAFPGDMVAISALAEGSDRLFAETALALGYTLEALLPMPLRDYEQTFDDPSATSGFTSLLARATTTVEMAGTLAKSNDAYMALGKAMVATCDTMLTVWDGKPAEGRGGTTEVIEHALRRNRPVVWIDSINDRPPLRLTAISPAIIAQPV